MRLGIIGGTFDPPHLAHLVMAEFAREQFELERILWVVAADPPHKQGVMMSPVEHRLAMVSLAIEKHPAFEISLVDVERPGPHYTVDMLDIIAVQQPGAEIYFLIGSDSFRDLPQWHEPHRLVEHAALGVINRPGFNADQSSLGPLVQALNHRYEIVEAPLIGISGTEIRDRVREGHTIRYLLPRSVEAYIHEHGLYRAAR